MSKFNDLLNLRFRQKDAGPSKMTALVEKSNNGELSSFSGVFRVTTLQSEESSALENILKTFRPNENFDVESDFQKLSKITSEVKAITNQAVILHGERIKKAQEILKSYKDGAFTAWLFATYGNRQTPYNFLQYYEFYGKMPQFLHPKIDQMPRQVIYTLASREGECEKKQQIIENFSGQTKQELLKMIRDVFPLKDQDKRQINFSEHAIAFLKKTKEMLRKNLCTPTDNEKAQLQALTQQIADLINKK